jgi:SAM-dependent methyltransferase
MSNDLNAKTFGAGALLYAAARPRYPAALFDWIADVAPARRLAWDAGCGSGQATVDLALRFESVIGSDSSAEQIALAPRICGIEWHVTPAEAIVLPTGTVDAAIAASAFHWFDLARFYPTLLDALSTDGVFVAFGYGKSVLPPEIQRPMLDAYADLQPYWSDGNRALWRGYRGMPFPLEEIEPPPFSIELSWTLTQWLDYTCTWSAYQRYVKETGREPREQIAAQIAPLWGTSSLPVSMPLTVRAGRRPG